VEAVFGFIPVKDPHLEELDENRVLYPSRIEPPVLQAEVGMDHIGPEGVIIVHIFEDVSFQQASLPITAIHSSPGKIFPGHACSVTYLCLSFLHPKKKATKCKPGMWTNSLY